MKGPGQLCVQNERARAALCAGGRGQSHPVCEMKGPGQLCARDEGARAALCTRGRAKGSSVHKSKGQGQLCVHDEGFLPQLFYHNITFLTFLKKVRNVMPRVAVVVINHRFLCRDRDSISSSIQ